MLSRKEVDISLSNVFFSPEAGPNSGRKISIPMNCGQSFYRRKRGLEDFLSAVEGVSEEKVRELQANE